MRPSNPMEYPFPSTATVCFVATLCACLVLGSCRVILGIPFAVALIYLAYQALVAYRPVVLGVVACLGIVGLLERDTLQSRQMFHHIGDTLYLPEGNYVIRDVSFGDGLGGGIPHVPTLHPFYLVDTPDGLALVEVPARVISRDSSTPSVEEGADAVAS